MTLAPAFQQALPAFDDIPTHYNHEVNGELLYKLCVALAARGLGTPETWLRCGSDCVAFARHSIMAAIGVEQGDLLQRNVEWNLEISDTFSDGYFTGEGEPLVGQGNSAFRSVAPAAAT